MVPSAHTTPPPAAMRAGACVSLTGPLATQGRDAAAGLRAWAAAAGAELTLEDDRGDPARVSAFYAQRGGELDVVLGPYGSGPTRAASAALAGSDVVLWNHGGAAIDRPAAVRVVDVLAPAERYWAGLAPALAAEGVDLARVVIADGPTPFGRAIGAGAERSLAEAGVAPMAVRELTTAAAESVAEDAGRVGAECVAGGATLQADLALAEACVARGVRPALVGLGITAARDRLGSAVLGGLGPVQWLPGASEPAASLGAVRDYPGAQAFAAGLLAERAVAMAGTTAPSAVWDAARALRTTTFLGPYAVDDEGRQTAHAPVVVRWVATPDGPVRELAWSPPGTGGPE